MSEAVPKDREELAGWGPMQPIFQAVTREFRITLAALLARGKSPTALQARQLCCWLAHRLGLRLSPEEIGQALGRDRQVLAQGIAAIEKRRREGDEWLVQTSDRLLVELREQLP